MAIDVAVAVAVMVGLVVVVVVVVVVLLLLVVPGDPNPHAWGLCSHHTASLHPTTLHAGLPHY